MDDDGEGATKTGFITVVDKVVSVSLGSVLLMILGLSPDCDTSLLVFSEVSILSL